MDKPPQISNDLEKKAPTGDFQRVLEAILLDTEYSISDLEFEFDLPWIDLKPLLDKSCTYTIENERVAIISKEKPGSSTAELRAKRDKEYREQKETKTKLKEIYGITFYKTNEYRSMPREKWPQEHTKLLEECIRLGIIQVWTDHGKKPMLVLEGHYPSHNNRIRD